MNFAAPIFIILVILTKEVIFGFKNESSDDLNDQMCCVVENSEAHREQIEKTNLMFQECRETLGNRSEELVCVTECVGKKYAIITDDKQLNEEGLKTFVTEIALETHHKDLVDNVTMLCAEEVRSFNASSEVNGCSSIPMRAVMCVDNEFFKACPENLQHPSKKCQQLREKVISGRSTIPV